MLLLLLLLHCCDPVLLHCYTLPLTQHFVQSTHLWREVLLYVPPAHHALGRSSRGVRVHLAHEVAQVRGTGLRPLAANKV
jgi:hypothetical protein